MVAETYTKSLGLKNVDVLSSGTNVNWDDPMEREYFSNTLRLLDRHGIKDYAKELPEQLTQARIDTMQITVCMNQRVMDEAKKIVALPADTINWNIIDIGEQHRTVEANKELYLEEIYQEIIQKVDDLLKVHNSSLFI